MIFFGIPSVGQAKPTTVFGSDDHYGFIQTLLGEEYVRDDIKTKCALYYSKNNNRYWDQIITLVNFLGLKRLNENNQFITIPLLDQIAERYDQDDLIPSKIVFDYLLCKWQYPHPIVTSNRATTDDSLNLVYSNQRHYPLSKPYAIILEILRLLYTNSPLDAYFSDDEFYWLGYNFYLNEGEDFGINDTPAKVQQILDFRENGGWDLYNNLRAKPSTRTHLSYPKGFLKNSSVLSDDQTFYPHVDELFIGLKPIQGLENVLNSLIQASADGFEFDSNRSVHDYALTSEFINYLYDPANVLSWLDQVELYPGAETIFDGVEAVAEQFDEQEYLLLKTKILLNRLENLDTRAVTRRRTEQSILRNFVLGNDGTGECAICNSVYPIEFLSAAHIKKRSSCSDLEKRDIHNVMAACYLGCDSLFERGYVVVHDGVVTNNIGNKSNSTELQSYIEELEGNACSAYDNHLNSQYFQFHETQNV